MTLKNFKVAHIATTVKLAASAVIATNNNSNNNALKSNIAAI